MFTRPGEQRGFTLIELLVVIGILAILVTFAFPVLSVVRGRAQRAQCVANLQTLAVGANLYLQQNGSWPQINTAANADKDEEAIAALWITALEPFSVPRQSWICPANQQSLHDPDYTQPGNIRIDYFATAFDDKPTTPHEWPRQPWFIETGDVHGNGNLILFADGSISDVTTEMKNAGVGP